MARAVPVRLTWALASGLIAGVATAAPLDPGSTLCLHPLAIPIAESKGEDRRVGLENKLKQVLVAAAFQVPDPRAVSDIRKRVEKEVGGFIDPATGRRDQARYQAYREQLAAALRSELHCDAQVWARVVSVQALFNGAEARWDGTIDTVSSGGRVLLHALGGVVESGWMRALSLWLHATDLEGNDLAFRTAGIEALVSLAVLRDHDILPEDAWLTDNEKLDAAIQSALGPNGDGLRLHGTPAGVDPVPKHRRVKSASQ